MVTSRAKKSFIRWKNISDPKSGAGRVTGFLLAIYFLIKGESERKKRRGRPNGSNEGTHEDDYS